MLTGCGDSKKNTTTTNESVTIENSGENLKVVSELGKTKKTDAFEITVTSAEIVDNPLNTDLGHTTLKVGVSAKNISKEETGIGTGDFKVKDAEGNEYTFTGSNDNFGDVVKAGDTIEGYGYYSIPNDMKAGVIIYNPYRTDTQQKWEAVFTKEKASESTSAKSTEKSAKETTNETNNSTENTDTKNTVTISSK